MAIICSHSNQPALVWLVPSTMTPILVTGLIRGELGLLKSYNEAPPQDKKPVRKPAKVKAKETEPWFLYRFSFEKHDAQVVEAEKTLKKEGGQPVHRVARLGRGIGEDDVKKSTAKHDSHILELDIFSTEE